MAFTARSIAVIQQQILVEKNAKAELAGLNTTSQTSVYGGWIYIQAVCIAIFEQILEVFADDEVEAVIAITIYNTRDWLRAKVKSFQYGDNPVLDIGNTYQVSYPTVDTTKQIVTFCVLREDGATVYVNAAKGTTPTQLSAGELSSLQDFLNVIKPPGNTWTAQTGDADLIRILANVNYDAKYVNTIQNDVFAELRKYIYEVGNNGILAIDRLLDVMNNAPGVINIRLDLVSWRGSTVPYGSSQIIFSSIAGQAVPITGTQYAQTNFGYLIEETTAGATWSDTITFTPLNP